jgi:hypothetical protein
MRMTKIMKYENNNNELRKKRSGIIIMGRN